MFDGKFIFLIYLSIHLIGKIQCDSGSSKVVCFYDSKSYQREGLGKVTLADLEPALPFCTHLVYGSCGINADTNRLESLNSKLDIEQGHMRSITQLRARFPQLKIMLSVGGYDELANYQKYLTLLESSAARIAFINSAHTMLKTYQFDGLDMAWQFPPNKPIKIKNAIKSFWKKLKDGLGISGGPIDEKSDEHREEFTALVRETRNAFRHDNYLLSVTVPPNVNSSLFYDVPMLSSNVDFIILSGFDFQTPARNPKEAHHFAPLYEISDGIPEANLNSMVLHWLGKGAPASKLIAGIPTYGRTWELTEGATETGVPPIHDIELPGPAGIQSQEPGLYTWPEICSKILSDRNRNYKGEDTPFRKVGDPSKRFGSYAYRKPDPDNAGGAVTGVWVSYEDPDSAGNKAAYVRAKGLGGIAIFDLSRDDFRGTCTNDKYPILRAAKYRL